MNQETENKVRLIQACGCMLILICIIPALLASHIVIPVEYWAILGIVVLIFDIKATASLVKKTARINMLRKSVKKG